jgi:septal ring factor EnvC (AmiA/AmiB activator)
MGVNMNFEQINKLMTESTETIRMLLAENQKLNEKIDKMRDHIVSLTDDLFAERRECIKLEDEIKDLKEQLLNEQWKNADADI